MERDITIPIGSHDTLDGVINQVQFAEDLGYDRLSAPEVVGRNSIAVLMLVIEKTDNIGISNNVFSVYSRTPALLGQTAASLQEASSGRFRMGLGTSSPGVIEQWHGLQYERPLRRLRETVEIVRQVCSGEQVEYEGDIFSLSGFAFTGPSPQTRPPLDIAMLGPKAVELAGRFADGWVPQLFTPDGLRNRLEDLERGAKLGNRSIDEIRVAMNLRCCALEDGDRARSVAREHLAFWIAVYGPYYRESIAKQGYRDVTEAVYDHWHDGDKQKAAEVIPDSLLEDIIAVGTPEEVRATVKRFEAVDGVDAVRVSLLDDLPIEDMNQTIEALSPAHA